MARITIPTKETVPTQTKAILEGYERNLGVIPNFVSLIARSGRAQCLGQYARSSGKEPWA